MTQGKRDCTGEALVEEIMILFSKVGFGCADVEGDAETGLVPNVDKPVFDDGVWQTLHYVVPPIRHALRIFERDVVLRHAGPHMHLRGNPEEPVANSMRSDQDAVESAYSAIPPTSSGSGPTTSTAWVSIRSLKFLAQANLFSGVNGSLSGSPFN
jgi:hypothetical protein